MFRSGFQAELVLLPVVDDIDHFCVVWIVSDRRDSVLLPKIQRFAVNKAGCFAPVFSAAAVGHVNAVLIAGEHAHVCADRLRYTVPYVALIIRIAAHGQLHFIILRRCCCGDKIVLCAVWCNQRAECFLAHICSSHPAG